VCKPRKIHVVADALLSFLNNIEPIGVDQTIDASLFHRLKWLNDVKKFLKAGEIKGVINVVEVKIG